ncbi:PREDICTED: ras-related protein Rab-39B-like, partial [Priapulus caudatus]|uniref:Ras-related protein Rab-39B-like n=1 Tax=Priapulus caudatus TaxID=37621 RepID=A0ABM1F675_PRICU
MVEPIYDYQFRLILVGDSTVGKSTLLRYFCDGKFDESCDPTVGVDFYSRLLEVKKGVRVKLQLWDTAGQERFRSITKSYYRNSVGGLVVFDISNRETFDSAPRWLAEARSHATPRLPRFVVVGHKADLESRREVARADGRQMALEHGCAYFETSAR